MSSFVIDVLENFLGECRKHNEETGQAAFDCPACSDDKGMPEGDGKGNLEINYNLGKFRCWACNETNNMSGPVSKLLKKYANSKTIRDYKLLRPDTFEYAKEKNSVEVKLPEEYIKLSEANNKKYKANLALNYLRQRGITDDIIKEFNIGYASHGEFFNRIIIPSYDGDNKLNYFIARWFSKEYTKIKYLNPTAEKQEIIFNENKINWDATIYLVEGVFDHLVIPNSIPLLGKYISPKLMDLLHDKAGGYIVIVLDGDAYEDAKALYKKLNFGDLKNRIKICRPPSEEDPSSIFQQLGPKGIIKLLRASFKLNEDEL